MDVNALKEIPGYKPIMKIVLQTQVQLLLEQLSDHTGGESIVMTASVNDGSLSYFGSNTGKGFLEGQNEIKSQFLAYCMKSHLQPKTQETTSKHKRSSDPHPDCGSAAQTAKRQRIVPTVLANDHKGQADDHSDRSFIAERLVHNDSHEQQNDTRTSVIPDVSLPSSMFLSNTQTSAMLTSGDNQPSPYVKDEPLTVGELGLGVSFEESGNSVGDSENGAQNTARLRQAAAEDQGVFRDSVKDCRELDEMSVLEPCNAIVDGEKLAQLLAEDEKKSKDSLDHYLAGEEDDERDEEGELGLNVGSSELGYSAIKVETIDSTPENEKSDIESDDDVIIIESDSDSNTDPKGSVDKAKQKHSTEKDSGNRSVKEQIVMQSGTSSPGTSGIVIKSVPSEQSNTRRSLVKRSCNVQRGNPHDQSRKDALETSDSLLNKPVRKVSMGKRKDSNSEGTKRQLRSTSKKRQNANKNDSADEAASDLSNVTVKTEAYCPIKTGEVDLRFSDSGRIRFDNGYCRYSEDEKAEVIRYAIKHDIKEAAEKYNVPFNTVRFWRSSYIRRSRLNQRKYRSRCSEEEKTEVIRYADKHGNKAASEVYNVPLSTLSFWQDSKIRKMDGKCYSRYSDERKAEIFDYASKHGINAASEVYNVPYNTVRRWRYSNIGKLRLNRGKGGTKYSKEEKEKITEYAVEHGTMAAVKKYKVPLSTVYVWTTLKKKGGNKANRLTAASVKRRMLDQSKGGPRYGDESEMKIVAWIKEKHQQKEYISGDMVRSYCLSLVKHKLPKFKATRVWLNGFLTRNHLKNYVADNNKDNKNFDQPVSSSSKVVGDMLKEAEGTQHKEMRKCRNATKLKNSQETKKRRKFTEMEKKTILRYAAVRSVRAACLLYKVNPSNLYAWRAARALNNNTRTIKTQIGKKSRTTTDTGEANSNDTKSEKTQNGTGTDDSENFNIGTENTQSDFIRRGTHARADINNFTDTENDESGPVHTQNDNSDTDSGISHDSINTTLKNVHSIQPGPDDSENFNIGTQNTQSDFMNRETHARADIYSFTDTENDESGPVNTQNDESDTDSGISHDSINTTLKNVHSVQPGPELRQNPSSSKRGKSVTYGKNIDDQIFWWIIHQGKQGKEVSGDMIKEYALSVVKDKLPNFKASDGWMRSFLKRRNLELHFSKE